MTDAHALLQAVWETGELTPLLALADLLDERDDHDATDLLRLTVADATTARHSGDRIRRLKQLRDKAWKRAQSAPWPDMAVQPDTSAAGFSRGPHPSSTTRETIVVRPERQTVHWLRVDLDGSEEVIRAGTGLELLRRELPPATAEVIRRGVTSGARHSGSPSNMTTSRSRMAGRPSLPRLWPTDKAGWKRPSPRR